MTEEVKEILDLLNFNKDTISNGTCQVEDFMSREQIIKLLDYITNLQQENERLKQFLFESVNNTNKAIEQIEIYRTRCEKAIEYINEHTLFVNGGIIKSILNGSDEK